MHSLSRHAGANYCRTHGPSCAAGNRFAGAPVANFLGGVNNIDMLQYGCPKEHPTVTVQANKYVQYPDAVTVPRIGESQQTVFIARPVETERYTGPC